MMATRLELTCNGQGCHAEPIYGGSIRHARRIARNAGWIHRRKGAEDIDLCPKHQTQAPQPEVRHGKCPECGYEHRLNQDGKLRSHRAPIAHDKQRWRPRCSGSYKTPSKAVA